MFSIPFEVERSITIHRPPAEVYAELADLGRWRAWSPWLCQEPDCPVTVEGQAGSAGHRQRWDGRFIGSGEMVLAEAQPHAALDYDLYFFKPWKSHSRAGFRLSPVAGGTQLSWRMRGSLPVFLFMMRRMMSAWVGSDFARGLGMLKEWLETGAVPSRLALKGTVDADGFHYLGIRRECATAEVGPAMAADFMELERQLAEGHLPAPARRLSLYHRYDLVAGRCEYTAAFGYPAEPDGDAGLSRGRLPAHRAVRVDHLGPYRHLGNGWAAAMGCQRQARPDKSLPMYEVYANLPGEVPEAELRTEIHAPVKS